MSFEIIWDKQPLKFLKKADKHLCRRILDKTETILSDNPMPHDAKPII